MSADINRLQMDNVDEFTLFTVPYIVIETTWTIHYVERTTYQDRGRFKWFAQTKPEAFEAMDKGDNEARRSHVDGADLFPRLYFLWQSFEAEFLAWLKARNLHIVSIKHGSIGGEE